MYYEGRAALVTFTSKMIPIYCYAYYLLSSGEIGSRGEGIALGDELFER